MKRSTLSGERGDVAPSVSQGLSVFSWLTKALILMPNTVNTLGVDVQDAFIAGEDNKLAS